MTPEDLLPPGDRWLLPLISSALTHGWNFEVIRTVNGHRDVTFTRDTLTVRIRGLRRNANLSQWVVDGVDLADLYVAQVPAALADPDRFLHPTKQPTDGVA